MSTFNVLSSAKYPSIQGKTISFRFDVTGLGRPENVMILENSAGQEIVKKATKSMSRSHFKPFVVEGIPTRMRGCQFSYTFK